MGTRLRKTRLAASGVLLAAVPVAMMQQPAAAAETTDFTFASVTFIPVGGGAATCRIDNNSTHNTDDPNQPYVEVQVVLEGGGPCISNVGTTITISYKDKGGVRRTASSGQLNGGTLKVEGAYSSITTTAHAQYFSCSSSSASCEATAVAHPK